MKKKKILLLFVGTTILTIGSLWFLSQKEDTTNQSLQKAMYTIGGISIIKEDTMVKITDSIYLLYRRHSNDTNVEKMWYDPYIVDIEKNDTFTINGFGYEYDYCTPIGEYEQPVSPNKRFIFLQTIDIGYLYDGETRKLHDHFSCVIVDIVRKKVVAEVYGSDCSGEWDSNNNWISIDKIVFSYKDYMHNLEGSNKKKLK